MLGYLTIYDFMTITLEKAISEDAKKLHALQIKCFLPLLDKYKDHKTNPACEPLDKTLIRINDPLKGFFKILKDKILVGGIAIKHTVSGTLEERTAFFISHVKIFGYFSVSTLKNICIED